MLALARNWGLPPVGLWGRPEKDPRIRARSPKASTTAPLRRPQGPAHGLAHSTSRWHAHSVARGGLCCPCVSTRCPQAAGRGGRLARPCEHKLTHGERGLVQPDDRLATGLTARSAPRERVTGDPGGPAMVVDLSRHWRASSTNKWRGQGCGLAQLLPPAAASKQKMA